MVAAEVVTGLWLGWLARLLVLALPIALFMARTRSLVRMVRVKPPGYCQYTVGGETGDEPFPAVYGVQRVGGDRERSGRCPGPAVDHTHPISNPASHGCARVADRALHQQDLEQPDLATTHAPPSSIER